jgi:hypothetical protein
MGCDIDVIIQVLIDGKWVMVREMRDIANPRYTRSLSALTSEEYAELVKAHSHHTYEGANDDCECFGDFGIHYWTPRNYAFFRRIANVRGYYGEVANQRGVPDDLDDVIRKIIIDYDDNKEYKYTCPLDLHSHTYYYDEEIDVLDDSDNYGFYSSNSMREFKELLKRTRDSFADKKIRFLICFDNYRTNER